MAKTKHVIFTTIDGVRPDGFAKADTPVIDSLIAGGASTMTAQTVFPSITLPVHTSLFYGVCPATHGVINNDFPLDSPVSKYTTLFDHLSDWNKKNLVFSCWEEFRNIYSNIGKIDCLVMEKLCWDYYNPTPQSEQAYELAYLSYAKKFAENFVKRKPDVAYVYLELPDVYGHNYEWMSQPYIDAIRTSDRAVGIILDIVKQAGLEDDVTIIVTSDHGGHDKQHGSNMPCDMTIPWVAYGKGIKQGYSIKGDVNILDTTATISDLLGVKPHQSWQGKILEEIYE